MTIRFDLLKNIKIPIEIFQLKDLSTLENIIYFLIHSKQLRQIEVAFLLKRDKRTIWTALTRAEYKIEQVRKREPKNMNRWERMLDIKRELRKQQEEIMIA